jgi:hypothetical protein
MKLEVANITWADVYKDVARVPEDFRKDHNGQPIQEGTICWVTAGHRTALLSLRGQNEHGNPAIHIDEKTRATLGVTVRDNLAFVFRKAGPWGTFKWAWQASDPAYRIATRLGILSVCLGLLGLALGVIGLVISLLK